MGGFSKIGDANALFVRKDLGIPMSIAKIFALVALVASVILLRRNWSHLKSMAGIFSIVAVVASALEIIILFRLFRLPFGGSNLMLILCVALAVTGCYLLTKVSQKSATISATLLSFVGVLQALGVFGIIPRL